MRLLILSTRDTHDLARSLGEILTDRGHTARVVSVNAPCDAETPGPGTDEDRPAPVNEAFDTVDYGRAHQWPVEPAWIETLLTLAGADQREVANRAMTGLIESTTSVVREHFDGADAVIAFDAASAVPMLHWSMPWLMIHVQKQPADAVVYKIARSLAPHLHCHGLLRQRGKRRWGSDSRSFNEQGLLAGVVDAAERLSIDSSPSRLAHNATVQKRYELRYEAASVGVYDEVYHRGAVYRKMDERLAGIISEATRGPGLRLLDLGCGPGSLVPALRAIPGLDYVGVDLVPAMIEQAREKYPGECFEVGDMEAIAHADSTFDVVLCSGVLHHLPDMGPAMREIRRVLKPGGVLVAREPNEDNFAARYPSLAFAHLCLRHLINASRDRRLFVEPDAHAFHRNFTMRSLVEELTPWFSVERLDTDLRVSYFYDIFESDADYAQIAEIEATLDRQPGLNAVIVARKARSGLSPRAAASLRDLENPPSPGPDHYNAFFDLIDRCADLAGADRLPPGVLDAGVWAVLDHLAAGRVLSAVTHEEDDIRMAMLEQHNESGITLERFERGQHVDIRPDCLADAVVVWADWRDDQDRLRELASACRDYGHIILLPGGTSVVPPESGVAPIAGLIAGKVVGVRNELQPGGPFTVIRKTTYTLLDVCRAIEVELAKTKPPNPSLLARLEETRRSLEHRGVTAFFEYVRPPEIAAPPADRHTA